MKLHIAILVLLMICACTTPNNAEITPALPTTAPLMPQVAMAGESIENPFHYNDVRTYDYSWQSSATNITTNFTQKVASDGANWNITSEMISDNFQLPAGTRGYTEFWFDKETQKCVKARNVIETQGEQSYVELVCGPTTTVGNNPGIRYPFIGEETVTVNAGTFATKKYGITGAVVYYMSADVPVPVKIMYGYDYYELERFT